MNQSKRKPEDSGNDLKNLSNRTCKNVGTEQLGDDDIGENKNGTTNAQRDNEHEEHVWTQIHHTSDMKTDETTKSNRN